MRLSLKLHPDANCPPVRSIEAEVERRGEQLRLIYSVSGDIDALRIPAATAPERADGLWRHTCFEAFVGSREGGGYLEFNLAPSGAWAAYSFSGYRAGMQSHETPPPEMRTRTSGSSLELEAILLLGDAGTSPSLQLGLSAVIEEASGRLSYWALRHPPGKPDFHHRDCFAVELPPAG